MTPAFLALLLAQSAQARDWGYRVHRLVDHGKCSAAAELIDRVDPKYRYGNVRSVESCFIEARDWDGLATLGPPVIEDEYWSFSDALRVYVSVGAGSMDSFATLPPAIRPNDAESPDRAHILGCVADAPWTREGELDQTPHTWTLIEHIHGCADAE